MFEQHFLSLIERFYGQAFSTIAAESRAVSERTMRSWLDGRHRPNERQLSNFSELSKSLLRNNLARAGWSHDRRAEFLTEVDKNSGAASALVHMLHWEGENGCPAALDLARNIDQLSLALSEKREHNDVLGFAKLFDSTWLTDEHFYNPEQSLSSRQSREAAMQVTQWAQLTVPTATLFVNLQLQLLATLDHEFSARYLPAFEPVPIFHGIFPDRIPCRNGDARIRGAVRLPIRRLLDAMACMRYYFKNTKWPKHVPRVGDAAIWMKVAPSTLAKWRMGRQFTERDFDGAWEKMFSDYPEYRRPGAPTPLMFAAVLLTQMFVIGSSEKRNLSIAESGATLYLTWWDRQRVAADAHLALPRTGTQLWMAGLL